MDCTLLRVEKSIVNQKEGMASVSLPKHCNCSSASSQSGAWSVEAACYCWGTVPQFTLTHAQQCERELRKLTSLVLPKKDFIYETIAEWRRCNIDVLLCPCIGPAFNFLYCGRLTGKSVCVFVFLYMLHIEERNPHFTAWFQIPVCNKCIDFVTIRQKESSNLAPRGIFQRFLWCFLLHESIFLVTSTATDRIFFFSSYRCRLYDNDIQSP